MRRLTRWGRVAAVAAAVLGIGIATVAAQTGKPKIALYISGDNLKPADKNILTRKFLSPFTASGMYSVIDRSDVFSQKVDQERKKQRDGSVSDSMIYVIGHEAGAKYVCIVELDYGLGRWNIGARMVDVVTAEIYLNSGETDIEGELNKADFSAAAKIIFNQIHEKSGRVAQTQQYQTPAPPPAPTPTPQYQAPTPTPAPTPAVAVQQPVYQTPKPTQPPPPPPPPTPKPSINYGSLRDSRDGKTYKTVVIGGKTWMAENINYQTSSGSWCYENNRSNCDKYGRLYDWKTAKTVCPAGFHLPSRQEWESLVAAAGGKIAAGKKLKARDGWNYNGNGTDDFGFSALPGGERSSNGGFNRAGKYGYWWTATESGGSNAYNRRMDDVNNDVNEYDHNRKDDGYSVRCVAD